jgi:hypothetical protein
LPEQEGILETLENDAWDDEDGSEIEQEGPGESWAEAKKARLDY